MRRKFMATISAVLVLVMFAGSTLAFAEPIMDVQAGQFSALQGLQAEPLSTAEAEQIKGAIDWKLVGDLASMWGKILQGMAECASGQWVKGSYDALKAMATSVYKAYSDYKNALISADKALKQLNDANKKFSDYRKTHRKK